MFLAGCYKYQTNSVRWWTLFVIPFFLQSIERSLFQSRLYKYTEKKEKTNSAYYSVDFPTTETVIYNEFVTMLSRQSITTRYFLRHGIIGYDFTRSGEFFKNAET
jgi:hypothetical protein